MVLVISTDAAAVWSYPVRTLTELTKTAQVIKSKDYASASPEDLIYANLARAAGLVTLDELAAFIDYGVALGKADVWASIINTNPFNAWPTDDVVSIFNNAYITADSVAKIIRSPFMLADRAQSILYRMADALYMDKLLNILTVDAADLSVTAATTLTSGISRYKTLYISSGVTLTVGAGPGVIIADTITNNGTIASGWVKGVGGAPGATTGKGGNGAGGIIILARTVTIGTITAKGWPGESGSTTDASVSGAAGAGGAFWVVSGDTVPVGGKGGGAYSGAGNPNGGGGGGSQYSYSVGGAGGSAVVTSFADAPSLVRELLKAAVDWWLVNILAKTPTTTKSFPSLGGSGGGGGADVNGNTDAGGGGGGGGEVIVVGVSVTAGTIDVSGGAGGNGGAEGTYDSGGGGGGGGIAYVLYKTITGTMNFIVSGGAGGIGDSTYSGAAGGAGVGRVIQI